MRCQKAALYTDISLWRCLSSRISSTPRPTRADYMKSRVVNCCPPASEAKMSSGFGKGY